jgi:histidyl-tRNA synthetase
VFSELDLNVVVKINHRQVLDSFLPLAGSIEAWGSFMQAIDKFDKIGQEGVSNELDQRGLTHMVPTWERWCEVSELTGFESIIAGIQHIPEIQNEYLEAGILALNELWQLLGDFPQAQLDLRLARGLSYYTGCVFEVVAADTRLPESFKIGSLGGGGRYDNLTGIFGLKEVSGVGVSFGLDRIYDTLEAFETENSKPKESGILICPMLPAAEKLAFNIAAMLRRAGLQTEVYPGSVKLKKQLDYANAKRFQFALILGETEIETGRISIKNLIDGSQQEASQDSIIAHLNHA